MNKEYNFVKRLAEKAPRSKGQLNTFYLSDAEVLKVRDHYLCTSVDTISEEISLGLIRDPKTLGWLSAIVSFSDLAAIGVAPQFLSLNTIHSRQWDANFEVAFKTGLLKACEHYNVKLVEYQSQPGPHSLITSTALSRAPQPPHLFRAPIRAGDSLYLTGPLGYGNSVAFANVALRNQAAAWADQIDQNYRPLARVGVGLFLNQFSSSCLDTSDGGLFSFDLLASLNGVGIEINYEPTLFHPLALELSNAARVHPFLFFAAQNGEFELLFSIPSEQESAFLEKARSQNFHFIKAGSVVERPGLSLVAGSRKIQLDISPIQNLLYDGASAQQYIVALMEFATSNQIEAF